MELFKRSMSRDFRIDVKAVDSVLNEEEEEEELEDECVGVQEEREGETDEGDPIETEEHAPAPKKLKR